MEFRFLDSGEAALVVEFGSVVDPEIGARVLALDAVLNAAGIAGLRETVPTYRSLMVHYDPLALPRTALIEAIGALEARATNTAPAARWTIPCCYEGACGEDLGEAASLLGLAAQDLACLHSGAAYRVAMYGFAPGFAYLAGLPEALVISRRATPRPPFPPGAILLGGGLSAIGSMPMPTGWFVIGRTPECLFAPERAPAFLIAVGDAIGFEPVDVETFDRLSARADAGEIVARREPLA